MTSTTMIKIADNNDEMHSGLLAFEVFCRTVTGKTMLDGEQRLLNNHLEGLQGYYLLQLSVLDNLLNYDRCPITHKFRMHNQPADAVSAYFEKEALPLEADSMDAIVLHHLLDYSPRPHELLRELSRITLPSGHLIIIGFNPYSLLGLQSHLSRKVNCGLKQRFYSPSKLCDWLRLVDFTVESVDYGLFSPPCSYFLGTQLSAKLERRCEKWRWPLGGFYIVKAIKRVTPATPISRRKKKPRSRMVPVLNPALPTRSSTLHKDDEYD